MPYLRTLAFLALVLAASPVRAQLPPESRLDFVDHRVIDFFGRDRAQIIEAPAEVETFRIVSHDHDEKFWRDSTVERLDGYVVSSHGVTLESDAGARLGEILLHRERYQFGVGKLCGGFHPGVALRFWKTKDHATSPHVDVLLCFTCEDLAFLESEQQGPPFGLPMNDLADTFPFEFSVVDMGPGVIEILQSVIPLSTPNEDLRARLVELLQEPYEKARRNREIIPALWDVLPKDLEEGGWDLDGNVPSVAVQAKAVEILRSISRAFGTASKIEGLDQIDEDLLAIAQSQRPQDWQQALEAMKTDRLAMFGAARIFFEFKIGDSFPETQRQFWAAPLGQVLLEEGDPDELEDVAGQLRKIGGHAVKVLLDRVARHELVVRP